MTGKMTIGAMKMTRTITKTDFATGPYGEILPPPLVSGVSPEEAAETMVRASHSTSCAITSIPTRGAARTGHINQGLLHLHQQNLVRALTGQLGDPDAVELRNAVLRGEAMSLRPLGLELLYFSSFVPVLQSVSDGVWRIGKQNQGKVKTFQAAPDEALTQAQRLYVEWATAETEQFKAWAQQATRQKVPTWHHLVWLADLLTTDDLTTDLVVGFALQRLGKHSTYRLVTPKGWRIIETARPERAVAIAAAVLQQQQISPPVYEAVDVLTALLLLQAPSPQAVVGGWQVGHLHAQELKPGQISLRNGQQQYGLSIEPALITLAERKQGGSIDRLTVDKNWSPIERQVIALTWAGWKAGAK